jgi:hypothetical protein
LNLATAYEYVGREEPIYQNLVSFNNTANK